MLRAQILLQDEAVNKIFLASLALLGAAAARVVSPAYAIEKSSGEWISEANLALAASPMDAKAFYNRGTGFYGSGDYESAVRDLSTTIALEPEASDAYFNRGLSYRRQRKFDEAISDFTKAIFHYSRVILISPEDADLYHLRGVAFFLTGDLDGAFADSVRALRINPDHSDAWRSLRMTLAWKDLSQDTRISTPGE